MSHFAVHQWFAVHHQCQRKTARTYFPSQDVVGAALPSQHLRPDITLYCHQVARLHCTYSIRIIDWGRLALCASFREALHRHLFLRTRDIPPSLFSVAHGVFFAAIFFRNTFWLSILLPWRWLWQRRAGGRICVDKVLFCVHDFPVGFMCGRCCCCCR